MGQMNLPEEIESELTLSRDAAAEGNDGKARVCARRAVGRAFRRSRYSSELTSTQSTTQILKAISTSDLFPPGVRKASARLSASVAENDGLSVSMKPVEDALVLITHLLGEQLDGSDPY